MRLGATDPLARFLESTVAAGSLPLVSTTIDVAVQGGLAIVTTERLFRNAEAISIEATMTFPVPIDATLCALSARIDGRTLHAAAQPREGARQTYEDALAGGKSAVLHEEPLRGIHVLSVGHIGPNAEITVVDTWTAFMSFAEPNPRLRIPTTVGEVYGVSPLPASDDLLIDGPARSATVRVACADGEASVRSATRLPDGRCRVQLDRPIEIVIAGWQRRRLEGISATGRAVTLDIEPAPTSSAPLDLDILFDRSGSMNESDEGLAAISKFQVAKAALCVAVRNLQPNDDVRIWEFNHGVDFIGQAMGPQAEALAQRIRPPDGGTEIGRALEHVIDCSGRKDVVMLTDGASWALDPHALAATGLRLTAVLVGEDALEALTAHLACLTGGEVFVASGGETAGALAAALTAARAPFCAPPRPPKRLERISVLRRGARIVATWGAKSRAKPGARGREIGATAAALAVPLMSKAAATRLAVAEGLVTHLTSLVLVDEAGATQHGVPARRPVPCSAPKALALACVSPFSDDDDHNLSEFIAREMGSCALSSNSRDDSLSNIDGDDPARMSGILKNIAARIDWDFDPDALCRGELSQLSLDVMFELLRVAGIPQVRELATALSVRPLVVALGLAARTCGADNRSAERVARAILGAADEAKLAELLAHGELPDEKPPGAAPPNPGHDTI